MSPEVERAVNQVVAAIQVPGSHPAYHQAQMAALAAHWTPLAKALVELLIARDEPLPIPWDRLR